jgi:hypothetical protein
MFILLSKAFIRASLPYGKSDNSMSEAKEMEILSLYFFLYPQFAFLFFVAK